MAVVAEFAIDAMEFPLGRLFEDMSGITLELERVIPTDRSIIPYLWVRGAEVEDISALPDRLPDLEAIALVDQVADEYLLRLEWKDSDGIVEAIIETEIVLLSGVGSADRWTFEVRGDDRDTVSKFQRYCREHDIPITLTGLHALSRLQGGEEYDLTDAQREALELAYERGYFQVPREASLEEIAEELGITGQSLGSRLRRGMHRLIGSTLI